MEGFDTLIAACVREGFSDLHITGGHPVVYRKHGRINFDLSAKWTHDQVESLVSSILTPRQLAILRKRWSVDFALSVSHVRLRVNVFSTTRGLSIAIRILPGSIPNIENLNLHPSLRQIASVRSGFVLICGPTGSGKSTTIAAIIDEINREKTYHIVTMEDPIEYRFSSRKSFIEQRELGTHITSFEQGLIDVLREAPDVILVGELRETEVMRLALNAAESGHLVIASLHASNSEDALYRIFNSFPADAQEAVRTQLAGTLAWVVVQRLDFFERAGFRVPCLSILKGTPAIKNIVRENKLAQLEGAIQTSKGEGMFTTEAYMKDFIDNLASFSPPEKIFRPSPEVVEPIYQSPLLDPDAVSYPQSTKPEPSGKDVPQQPEPQPAEAQPEVESSKGYFQIDNTTNLDELLDEIKKSGRYTK